MRRQGDLMTYELLAAAIFIVFSLVYVLKMDGANQMFLTAIVIWPFAMLVGGNTTLAAFTPHLIAGFVMFILGFTLFAKVGIGGGVAKGMAVIALWVPSALLMRTITSILILGAAAIVVATLVSRKSNNDSFDHYATLMFAIAAGVILLQGYFPPPV